MQAGTETSIVCMYVRMYVVYILHTIQAPGIHASLGSPLRKFEPNFSLDDN